MNVTIKCRKCKKNFDTVILMNAASSEEECGHCGEWNYWERSKEKKVLVKKPTVKLTPAPKKSKIVTPFKKGQKVRKTIYHLGKVAGSEVQTIYSIKKGIINLANQEGNLEEGITYNLQGEENENFFPGFTSKIKLLK